MQCLTAGKPVHTKGRLAATPSTSNCTVSLKAARTPSQQVRYAKSLRVSFRRGFAPSKRGSERGSFTGAPQYAVRVSAGIETLQLDTALAEVDITGATWKSEIRARVAKQLPAGGLIYLEGRAAQSRNGSDVNSPFRNCSNFLYLTGVPEQKFAALIDTDTGKLTLFSPTIPQNMIVWVGDLPSREEIAARYGADECLPLEELHAKIHAMQPEAIYALPGVYLPEPGAGEDYPTPPLDHRMLKSAIAECRCIKTEAEVACLQRANDISSGAHEAMWRACSAGVYEYQLEAVFVQHTMTRGLRHMGYPCIVGSGRNAGILHYDRNEKQVQEGDLVLVDAGAECGGYTADISRTFPGNGRFDALQRDLYSAVLHIQESSIERLQPGAAWETVSEAAQRTAAECLLELGLVSGPVETLMELDIPRLFFCHGLGHLLGLDVHDVGPAGRPVPEVLKPGMVVTCEPGLYLVDSMIQPALQQTLKRGHINEDAFTRFAHLGGVRIEDDVLITAGGHRNLTSAAKSITDIEHIMAQ